jgi:hypothetical protein
LAILNSVIINEKWEIHSLEIQENITKGGRLPFILNMYVNVCKRNGFGIKIYFRISRGEKLRELAWKEIEDHKYSEEETPASNELHDINSVFTINHEKFVQMINISIYIQNKKRTPYPYHINYNSSKLKL